MQARTRVELTLRLHGDVVGRIELHVRAGAANLGLVLGRNVAKHRAPLVGLVFHLRRGVRQVGELLRVLAGRLLHGLELRASTRRTCAASALTLRGGVSWAPMLTRVFSLRCARDRRRAHRARRRTRGRRAHASSSTPRTQPGRASGSASS